MLLYELCGLSTAGLKEYLGEPPEETQDKGTTDKDKLREFRERFISDGKKAEERLHRGGA